MNVYSDIGLTILIDQVATPIKTDGLGNAPTLYTNPAIIDYTVSGAGVRVPNGPYIVNVGGISIGTYTIATLPVAVATNALAAVTDGNGINCTVGGGTTRQLCQWNGSSWILISGSSGGGSTPAGPTGTLQCTNGTILTACGVVDDTTNLNVSRDLITKGPNPWIDIRSAPYGAKFNGSVATTCTMTRRRLSLTGKELPASELARRWRYRRQEHLLLSLQTLLICWALVMSSPTPLEPLPPLIPSGQCRSTGRLLRPARLPRSVHSNRHWDSKHFPSLTGPEQITWSP